MCFEQSFELVLKVVFFLLKENPLWRFGDSGSGPLVLVPVLYLLDFQGEIFERQVPGALLAQLPAFPLQLLNNLDAPEYSLLRVSLLLDDAHFFGQGTCKLCRWQEMGEKQCQSVGIGLRKQSAPSPSCL